MHVPPPSPNAFAALTSLMLRWYTGAHNSKQPELNELHSLVRSTPHVRALHLHFAKDEDIWLQRVMTEIASWPPTVLPQLQHICFALDEHKSDREPTYQSLLAHLPQLIAHRPVHPCCVHIFDELSDEAVDDPTSNEFEQLHLPCVRLTTSLSTPTMVDERLLRKMDAAARTITVSKAELLQLLQAEYLRVFPPPPEGASSASAEVQSPLP